MRTEKSDERRLGDADARKCGFGSAGCALRGIIRDTPYLPPSRTNAFFNPHKRKGNATWNFFCILSGPRRSFFWS